MIRKIVWYYLFVLTLLDISLNNKLSAQGKSHGNGASVQEPLMEGISLQQEWGSGVDDGDGGGRGRSAPTGALTLSPASLAFGRAALAEAHSRSVTITNTANETIHLASVAGTTPDFHASFFESKTLACGANTTFSVVYLGRGAGWVSTHLYIHTSVGVHAYPVSALGEHSAWRLHPLVGLRVPANATLEPLLTLYNPTDTTIQIREVYSSGAWLGLALPEGGGAAPRALWALPPHTARPLVRLTIRLPHHLHHDPKHPLTAYIRIKGNMTGGGLVVGVEATPAPPGEFLSPLQLRLNTRGSRDEPLTVYVSAGSSAETAARLEGGVWGAACGARPPASRAPPPPPPSPPPARDKATHNGGAAVGAVDVALLRDSLDPFQELTPAAKVTIHYGKMWAGYEASLANGSAEGGALSNGSEGGAGEGGGAYCSGWVRVGRAALPYSLRLLPGTLSSNPKEMHFVAAAGATALSPRYLEVRNEFPEPLHISHVHFPKEIQQMFHSESLAPLSLGAGARGLAVRLQLRSGAGVTSLSAHITLHTNVTEYSVLVLVYSGSVQVEWRWPGPGPGWAADTGTLRLGTLTAGSVHQVEVRLRNTGPAPLCLTHLEAELPPPAAASFNLQPGTPSCVAAGGWADGVLTVRPGVAAGELSGALHVHTAHARHRHVITMRARAGSLVAAPLVLPPAAPWVWSSAELQLENSLGVAVSVVGATPPRALPALHYEGAGAGAGRVRHAPEAACAATPSGCYAGLALESPEGAAWGARGPRPADEALRLDAALQRARYALYLQQHAHPHNFTMHLHTDEVAQVAVSGSATLHWPRVWSEDGGASGGRAPLAAVGGTAVLRLRAHNPSQRPLLLQPRRATAHLQLGGEGEEMAGACVGCVWSVESFSLGEWRAVRGLARAYNLNADDDGHAEHAGDAGYVLLQPYAEIEFTVTFSPAQPADLAAYIYLRNNLTIVERVLVRGRGALPAFELGGRKPNASAAIVLEVGECGGAGAGLARRALLLRNTGLVPLRLRDWRIAGEPCVARSFRLEPCAAHRLAPGDSLHLHLSFGADWTRARARAVLTVLVSAGSSSASLATFQLSGLAPRRLRAACEPRIERAPFEARLRYLALTLALVALLGAAALGAADAERALRRDRTARRARAEPRAPPLDLRALADPCPTAAAAAAATAVVSAPTASRRRRTPRRRPPVPDPAAERRAFERWRVGLGAGASNDQLHEEEEEEEDSRSSEEAEPERAPPSPPPPLPPPAPVRAPPRGDASSSDPDSEPQTRDSYPSVRGEGGLVGADVDEAEGEEPVSSGSESSSPGSGEACAMSARGRERRRPRAIIDHTSPTASHTTDRDRPSRGSRQRRESAEARRSERVRADATSADNSSNGTNGAPPPVRALSRPHARKDRPTRRRAVADRAPSPEPRLRLVPALVPSAAAAPLATPAAPAPVRWGASWSDVVSRSNLPTPDEGCGGGSPAPLAPIGSDVRRRHASNSLFYYGPAPAWPPAPPPVPAPPGDAPAPPDEGGYRSLEALWTGGAAPATWLWGAGAGGDSASPAEGAAEAVRPPPGFAAPRPVRPYDPFQSLASIWTPAALDWRLESPAPSPVPPATPPLHDDRD